MQIYQISQIFLFICEILESAYQKIANEYRKNIFQKQTSFHALLYPRVS